MTGKPTPQTQSEDRLGCLHRIVSRQNVAIEWLRQIAYLPEAEAALAEIYKARKAAAQLKALECTWYAEVREVEEIRWKAQRES